MTDIAAYVRAAVRRLGPPDRETIARIRAIVRPALPATPARGRRARAALKRTA